MKNDIKTIHDYLFAELKKAGYDGRIVSISRLADLRQALESRNEKGEFDPAFYADLLTYFDFKPPATMQGAASIIVTAVPQPMTRIVFHYQGKANKTILPPTYIMSVDEKVKDAIGEALLPRGYHMERGRLPAKTLAVRSGLCEYGRNNIAYHRSYGSFLRIVIFYTDLPCGEDGWREPVMMESCVKCENCLKNCPTQAIPRDRFLLRQHLCLTYYNEHDYGFPSDLDPSVHQCIVGCMRCQTVCPANKDVREWTEPGETFDERETAAILESRAGKGLPDPVVEKLQRLYLWGYRDILPRNLRACLEQSIGHKI